MSSLSRPSTLSLPKAVAVFGAAGTVVMLGATMALAAGAESAPAAGDTSAIEPAAIRSSPTGSSSAPAAQPGTGSSSAPAAQPGTGHRARPRMVLRHAAHASLTVERKSGFVTYTLAKGKVMSVSSTSISVKAKDGFVATYAVTASTKVIQVTQVKQGAVNPAPTIGSVKSGDTARVIGTGTSSLTATRIVTNTPVAARPS